MNAECGVRSAASIADSQGPIANGEEGPGKGARGAEIRVGIITPDAESASSWYRAMGPFSALEGVRILTFPGWGWNELVQCDVVFMHRPYHPMHLKIMEMARGLGVRVWLDWDDDLLAVPYWHASAGNYGAGFRELLGRMLAVADLVTVSTVGIAISYNALRKDERQCVVLANAWDERLGKRQVPSAKCQEGRPAGTADARPDATLITWRSGVANSHMQDLESVLPALGRVARKFPSVQFCFLGQPHWRVREVLGEERVRIVPGQDFLGYLRTLQGLRPTVHIVPMVDSAFNQAKSNCAWLEATAAGATVVAPDFAEWRVPGVYRYSQGPRADSQLGGFEEVLETALVDPTVKTSREFIRDYLGLRATNRMRAGILRILAGPEALE